VGNTFEARVSGWLLTIGVIGSIAFSAMFWCFVFATDNSRWLTISCAALFSLLAGVLVARKLCDFPVVQIDEKAIVFRNHLFPFVCDSIPLANICRAHSFWQDCSSSEDSLDLVIVLRGHSNWNRSVFNGNITPLQREKLGLPFDCVVLEFPCNNCQPPPKAICQAINDRLKDVGTI